MITPKSKIIGSIFIVIGTAIGAGMLALPMISAGTGFYRAALLTILTWALMTATGLLVLEVTLVLPKNQNHFSSMAEATLGKGGKIATTLTCLLLLYSLTAAYIAGNTSLITSGLEQLHMYSPAWINALLFILVLGGAVTHSTRTVDHLNRGLLSIKGLLLIVAMTLLIPHIHVPLLTYQPATNSEHIFWLAAPIFLCSFGYHTVIPSLCNYIGAKPKQLKMIIICGSSITLVVYLLWLAAALGTLPATMLVHTNGAVGDLINLLCSVVNNQWVSISINGFANIAMTTSFLGVTLGLFDFLADACRRSDTAWGRLQTAGLTFIPPLIFALFYPHGFVMALGYASIFVAILTIILPALMVYKLQSQPQHAGRTYRFIKSKVLLIMIGVIGVAIIGLQLAA